MTRSWVDYEDHRWVMYCDYCYAKSEPRAGRHGSDVHPLEEYRDKGWFIAKRFGDRCPKCVKDAGGMSAITTEPYTRWSDGAA